MNLPHSHHPYLLRDFPFVPSNLLHSGLVQVGFLPSLVLLGFACDLDRREVPTILFSVRGCSLSSVLVALVSSVGAESSVG